MEIMEIVGMEIRLVRIGNMVKVAIIVKKAVICSQNVRIGKDTFGKVL